MDSLENPNANMFAYYQPQQAPSPKIMPLDSNDFNNLAFGEAKHTPVVSRSDRDEPQTNLLDWDANKDFQQQRPDLAQAKQLENLLSTQLSKILKSMDDFDYRFNKLENATREIIHNQKINDEQTKAFYQNALSSLDSVKQLQSNNLAQISKIGNSSVQEPVSDSNKIPEKDLKLAKKLQDQYDLEYARSFVETRPKRNSSFSRRESKSSVSDFELAKQLQAQLDIEVKTPETSTRPPPKQTPTPSGSQRNIFKFWNNETPKPKETPEPEESKRNPIKKTNAPTSSTANRQTPMPSPYPNVIPGLQPAPQIGSAPYPYYVPQLMYQQPGQNVMPGVQPLAPYPTSQPAFYYVPQ